MKKLIVLAAVVMLTGCGGEKHINETFAHEFVETIETENIEVERIQVNPIEVKPISVVTIE